MQGREPLLQLVSIVNKAEAEHWRACVKAHDVKLLPSQSPITDASRRQHEAGHPTSEIL